MPEREIPKKLGRYEIVRWLGEGAFSIVYEGRDPNIGRRVAIKTPKPETIQGSGGAEVKARFLREARAAGALHHPNIVTIYDADEENGIAYIAMEFIEGQELRGVFEEKQRMDATEAVEVVATLCSALAHAHERGIVHRDIKPSNVMILKDGALRIADFGIARTSDSNMTKDGTIMGTPYYMSPEQFRGRKADGRSDLFSAAVILYELLTGEKPFPGEAVPTVMHNVLQTDPVPPNQLDPIINDVLNAVVLKALSKAPDKRYPNGVAMANALREALKENPDPAITQVGKTPKKTEAEETTVVTPTAVSSVSKAVAPVGAVDETTQKSAPAPAISAQAEATARMAPWEAPIRRRPKALTIGAPAAGIGIVALFIAFFLMPKAPDESTLKPPDEPYWKQVTFRLLSYESGGDSLESRNPSPASMHITITDKDTSKVVWAGELDQKDLKANPVVVFPEGMRVTRFHYRVENAKYNYADEGDSLDDTLPTKPGDSYPVIIEKEFLRSTATQPGG